MKLSEFKFKKIYIKSLSSFYDEPQDCLVFSYIKLVSCLLLYFESDILYIVYCYNRKDVITYYLFNYIDCECIILCSKKL